MTIIILRGELAHEKSTVVRLILNTNRQHMKKNMSSADSIIRVIIAAIIAFLYYKDIIQGTLGIILLILAGIFIITSLVRVCPIYSITGISTQKKNP
jgi:hypothetical protein